MNYREAAAQREGEPTPDWFLERPQIPYVIPFLGFLVFMVPGSLGHLGDIDWEKFSQDYQPLLYAAKSITAALLLWRFWNYYTPIRWSKLPLGVLAGIVGTILWIGTEYLCQHFGFSKPPDPKTVYNPDLLLPNQWQQLAYLCIRIAGPTLVVPVMEELFFRDFLMRAIITGGKFEDVPVGTFTWPSLLIMSALFGINHGHQWPAGVLYGLLMGILLIRTKSLGACIVAHGVTNFTLYLYVVYTGDWQFM